MGNFARTPNLEDRIMPGRKFRRRGMKHRAMGGWGAFTLEPAARNFQARLISDHLAVTEHDIDFNSIVCFKGLDFYGNKKAWMLCFVA